MQNTLTRLTSGKLDPSAIQDFLNRAQRDLAEENDWARLRQVQTLNSVAPIIGAPAVFTQGSPDVVIGPIPPVPPLKNWFLWGPSPDAGPPIRVTGNVAFPFLNVYLEVPWAQPSTTASCMIAPTFYEVPGVLEIYEVRQQFPLNKRSREWLNTADPGRIATGGDPSTDWAFGPMQDDNFTIELWPLPGSALNYLLEVKLAAVDMTQPNQQPMLPSKVVEEAAMVACCETMFAQTAGPEWARLIQTHEARLAEALEKALVADRAVRNYNSLSLNIERAGSVPYSIDINHDLSD